MHIISAGSKVSKTKLGTTKKKKYTSIKFSRFIILTNHKPASSHATSSNKMRELAESLKSRA